MKITKNDWNMQLHSASCFGDSKGVQEAIENGADVNYNYGISLMHASYYGHFDIVKYLVSKGADISVNYKEYLKYLIVKDYNEIKEILDFLETVIKLRKIKNKKRKT